jgi:hypothetical protein
MVTNSPATRQRHGTPPPRSTEATKFLQLCTVRSLSMYETIEKARVLGVHDAAAAAAVGERTAAVVAL